MIISKFYKEYNISDLFLAMVTTDLIPFVPKLCILPLAKNCYTYNLITID